ncbi:MAG TPA: hypothetical protein VF861_03905 [Telluria sp.]
MPSATNVPSSLPGADTAPLGTVTAPLITTSLSSTAVTDVRIENTNAQVALSNQPLTFGQVFAPGHVLPANSLVGKLEDGTVVPLQADVKALHPDGSVRHAIISAVLPNLAAGQVRKVSIEKSDTAPAAKVYTVDNMMATGFSASVHATINGVEYAAYADDALKEAVNPKTWLAGPVVTEWLVSAPLTTDSGQAHPHLSARFAIRWYSALNKIRVDMTVENDWAYEPAPQNFTYDAKVKVAAQSVYTKTALTHLHHARWRKVFWFGGEAPAVNVKHNTAYLIGSRALPNYDQSVPVPESALAALKTRWTGAITEPMAVGMANAYMASTGGREDIGLLPGWSAVYLLSMDQRAKAVTLGTADLAGSWSSHYRDKKTDRPISVRNYPYMTIVGNPGDTYNPATKLFERFPTCATTTACATPNQHDTAHQPGFAYLPYLVTGDYYYLEELQFWAMYNTFSSNPGYRDNIKGLVKDDQVRGQGWSMRTLAEVTYITPDNDPLKADFQAIMAANLDWYNANYTNNASANALGVLVNGNAMAYNNGRGMAPWQDDFFTAAIGHAAELGFTSASSLLDYKAKFAIMRMNAPGVCWIDGSIYALNIRDTATSPFYSTMEQAYKANHTAEFAALQCGSAAMATSLGLALGEMTGYSTSAMGYPANMQPALAYGADVGGASGKGAWAIFAARAKKPDYSSLPQFNIVPR